MRCGPEHYLRCRSRPAGTPAASVSAAEDGSSAEVSLEGGGRIAAARGVIVAADGPVAVRLLGDALHSSPSKPDTGVGTACVYFSCAFPGVSPPDLLTGDLSQLARRWRLQAGGTLQAWPTLLSSLHW